MDNNDMQKEIAPDDEACENSAYSGKKNKKKKEKEKRPAKLELYDWFQCFVMAVVFGVLIFMFVARVVNVRGTSMYSTLCNGDMVLCSDLFYTPEQGDIIVFESDSDEFDHSLVKRIIAVSGQTVDIDFNEGIVYVDGEALYEPYIRERTYDREDFVGPVTVPDGCVFVMGDNRNGSTDSRDTRVGYVEERNIIGKVYFIIAPGEDMNGMRFWSRVGSVYESGK